MISEALQFLSPDPAEDAWEDRFIPVEASCSCDRGWLQDETGWYRCLVPGCDLGEITVEQCSRCGKDESGCFCVVEDFK